MTDLDHILFPNVNISGTAKVQLLEDYSHLLNHLRATLHEMKAYGPHPRDYQGPMMGNFRIAVNQHGRRIDKIEEIIMELEYIQLKVADQ